MDASICSLVLALTEDATIADFTARKESLREQVRQAGGDAVTIFAADKLSDIRGLRRGIERHRDSIENRMGTTVGDMAGHYEESVAMIEECAELSFATELRSEFALLANLAAPAAPA